MLVVDGLTIDRKRYKLLACLGVLWGGVREIGLTSHDSKPLFALSCLSTRHFTKIFLFFSVHTVSEKLYEYFVSS